MPVKLTRTILFIITLPSVLLWFFIKKPLNQQHKSPITILLQQDNTTAKPDTEENRFTKNILIEKMDEPLQLAVLDVNRVLYIERKGRSWLYDNIAKNKKLVATIPASTKSADNAWQ